MGIPRFYVQELTGLSVRLSDQESSHAARSKRLAAGEEVVVFDGGGGEAVGRVTSVGRLAVDVALGPITRRPRRTPALTLAVALPKGPRQDLLIEKCTELGTAAIVPLITQRSVSLASEHKLDRWKKTAIEAAKQSGQAWLPQFYPPEKLSEALERVPVHQLAVVAAPARAGDVRTFAAKISNVATSPSSVLAFVGPEGGFADEELSLLTAGGCQPVSLGPNILRIETAAIVLAAMVHLEQSGNNAAADIRAGH